MITKVKFPRERIKRDAQLRLNLAYMYQAGKVIIKDKNAKIIHIFGFFIKVFVKDEFSCFGLCIHPEIFLSPTN